MPYSFPAVAALSLLVLAAPAAADTPMPANMVYLRSLDPSIAQDIRYASPHNFTGAPLDGYNAAECVLSADAAKALVRVQAELARQGYGLKVFDCYRPSRAVANMGRFASLPGDPAKAEFYPRVNKQDFWRLGYVAKVSNHSRGAAVDVTLTGPDARPAQAWSADTAAVDCAAGYGRRLPDGGLDMGTGFDCFDEMAHTNSPHISQTARQNRQRLSAAMAKEGFAGYAGEWWHFTYSRNPVRAEPMDFPIEPLR
jgi:D-alanyl-D-alanine dipeptidase